MCGIACILDQKGILDSHMLSDFTNAVRHRGPDGFGFAKFAPDLHVLPPESDKFHIGMGHRRLSIIDLSPAGAQPMFSSDGDYVVVYNGEIYNHIELRSELEKEGSAFKSHCDTEVLLEAYAKWGIKCLSRFNGMWSFVILDRRKRQLFVSRDRIGVKPLYYYHDSGILAFASEIKQFFRLPMIKKTDNLRACLSYLATGYEIPPETFYKKIFSFPPASHALIEIDAPEVKSENFWNPEKFSSAIRKEEEIIPLIRESFSNSVKLRLRSDVSVGGCLSGGIDSSSIFVEMKKLQPRQVFSAFSACFEDPEADESRFMKRIVEKTESRHVCVFPKDAELVDDWPKFMLHHDEPVGSLSMYAQFKIMESARHSGIPVLLDGQGGDEIFSGYWPAYMLLLNNLRRNYRFACVLKHFLGAILPSGNSGLFGQSFSQIREYRKRSRRILPFQMREKHQELLSEIHTSSWHSDARYLSPEEYRRAEITRIHLPRLLKWEDRNSMAFSIESRVPFLDVHLVELLLSVNPEMNIRGGWTKYLLRNAMAEKLPHEICWRKDKRGFETPQKKWMRKGVFHNYLLRWCGKNGHPAEEFISTDFREIRGILSSGDFDSTSMFRLFCLDYWMKSI